MLIIQCRPSWKFWVNCSRNSLIWNWYFLKDWIQKNWEMVSKNISLQPYFIKVDGKKCWVLALIYLLSYEYSVIEKIKGTYMCCCIIVWTEGQNEHTVKICFKLTTCFKDGLYVYIQVIWNFLWSRDTWTWNLEYILLCNKLYISNH